MVAPGGRALAECPVLMVNVIVLDVLVQDQPQVFLAVISIWSRHSRRAVQIHRSAMAFARGARTGALMISMPALTG